MPLLFGVYGIVGIALCCGEILKYLKSKMYRKKRNISKCVISLSAVVPLALLSIFPHHEARYILPVLTPLILISSDAIFSSRILLSLNILHNVIGLLVMGLFHQGGITPCLHRLSEHLHTTPNVISNVVFYKTYMPPQHLLLLPKDTSVNIEDYAGMPQDEFMSTLNRLLQDKNDVAKTYLVVPYPVMEEVFVKPHFQFEVIESFFPHLSTENFPNVSHAFNCDDDSVYCSKSLHERFKMQFSLVLLSITNVQV